MTPDAGSANSGYGDASSWAQVVSAIGQGGQSAMQGATANANSRKEAREAKRRTLAKILDAAMKRRTSLFRVGQENQDDLSDYKSKQLQNVARGFINSLQGSTEG